MAWSASRKRQHRDVMRCIAEGNRCPQCGRGSAVVYRRSAGGRTWPICRWVDKGMCDYAPDALHEVNPFKLT